MVFGFSIGAGKSFFQFLPIGLVLLYLAVCLVPQRCLAAWAGDDCHDISRLLGMFRLVGSRVGSLAGGIAGTFFITAEYPATDLWIRGDFSEYAAMMLVPYWIHALLDIWQLGFDHPNRSVSKSWLLPWMTGGIAIMHPCVAMQVAFIGGPLILGLFVWYRQAIPLRNTVCSLLVGVILAGVYWITWLGEFRYVQPDVATEGFFHYSKNFASFLELFNSSQTKTVTNVKFGIVQTVILLSALVFVVLGWKVFSKDQRLLVVVAGIGLFLAFFLINPWSEPFWKHVPLLKLQQFPWRFLVFVTIGASIIVGFLGNRAVDDKWQFVGLVLLLVAVVSRIFAVKPEPTPFTHLTSARDIATTYFAPDVGNEWLPKGAKEFATGEPLQKTYTGPSEMAFSEGNQIQVRETRRMTGRIECDLSSREPTNLTLRHYYYPVGWRGWLNDKQVTIERSSDGLMQIAIPAQFNGRLSLQFSTTPMRRLGIAITLLAVMGLTIFQIRSWKSP